MGSKVKVVFLDRDGVINRHPGDFKYVTTWEKFHFLPGVKLALKRLNDSGFRLFIASNQAGVSKGIFSQKKLDLITKNMLGELRKKTVVISGVYYCTHRHEENCACRKPKTGLLDLAIVRLKAEGQKIDLAKSYFIGDTERDIQAGKSSGLNTILVFSGKEKGAANKNWKVSPDLTAKDLSEAVELILKNE